MIAAGYLCVVFVFFIFFFVAVVVVWTRLGVQAHIGCLTTHVRASICDCFQVFFIFRLVPVISLLHLRWTHARLEFLDSRLQLINVFYGRAE